MSGGGLKWIGVGGSRREWVGVGEVNGSRWGRMGGFGSVWEWMGVGVGTVYYDTLKM